MKWKKYDVVVVGAGPSGCAASKILKNSGAKVLLLDKYGFKKNKGCGGGITPKALKLIKQIFPEIELKANSVNCLEIRYVHKGLNKEVCRFSFSSPVFHVVSRSEFDMKLLEAVINNGVKFSRERVRSLKEHEDAIVVETDNSCYLADYAIVSAGIFGSSLLSREFSQKYSLIVHRKAKKTSEEAALTFFENGYAWYFPGFEHASMGAGVYIEGKESFMLSKNNLMLASYMDEDLKITPIPSFSLEFLYEVNRFMEGCLVVGDSAGFVDSWTGEGISYALYTGAIAARTILKYRKTRLNERFLNNTRPIMENLVMALGLRNSFIRNFPDKVELIRDKRFARLLFSYLSSFSKNLFRLVLKSYLVPRSKVQIV
ncbi:FAD-dependent monooxygenase [Kosmotoga pacifica]|uniref:FAD-binding domain-containing protein n=1 Tax=Kosmotoga pacifica TaxID=1330330 RepID=A0A0G2ZDB1_9BACT|nr:FAD-dependent monooxygenase [Kosmotoga pacifica]AKI96803.1 hypothetical protein IX53_02060 [Kosmotoga pacifica]